jgi:hypothetical protein
MKTRVNVNRHAAHARRGRWIGQHEAKKRKEDRQTGNSFGARSEAYLFGLAAPPERIGGSERITPRHGRHAIALCACTQKRSVRE